jgi:hypothetical protein
MKRGAFGAACWLLTTAWSAHAPAAPPGEAGAGALSIEYDHAGLTGVNVKGTELRYVWHTLKPGPGPHPQSLDAYDRHEVRKRLAPAEQSWLARWVTKHRVFRFRSRYPSSDPRSYGAAFVSRLQVKQGGKTQTVRWDDTSRAPEPEAAARELTAWAARVAGIRGAGP